MKNISINLRRILREEAKSRDKGTNKESILELLKNILEGVKEIGQEDGPEFAEAVARLPNIDPDNDKDGNPVSFSIVLMDKDVVKGAQEKLKTLTAKENWNPEEKEDQDYGGINLKPDEENQNQESPKMVGAKNEKSVSKSDKRSPEDAVDGSYKATDIDDAEAKDGKSVSPEPTGRTKDDDPDEEEESGWLGSGLSGFRRPQAESKKLNRLKRLIKEVALNETRRTKR